MQIERSSKLPAVGSEGRGESNNYVILRYVSFSKYSQEPKLRTPFPQKGTLASLKKEEEKERREKGERGKRKGRGRKQGQKKG